MALTAAERQRRYYRRHRDRLAEERRAAAEREHILELIRLAGRDPACACCGERHLRFLVAGTPVYCANCASALRRFGFCSAHAVGVKWK